MAGSPSPVSYQSSCQPVLVRKRLRIAAAVTAGLLIGVVGGLVVAYWALRQEPEFYQLALRVDRQVQEQASDRMLQIASGGSAPALPETMTTVSNGINRIFFIIV